MQELIFKILTIFLLSMLKFIFGPTLGYASNLNILTTITVTIGGMMTSVFLFTYLGKVLRERILKRLFKKQKKFSPKTRRFVRIWNRFGLKGVAFLTPLIFTPIGGTVLLTSLGAPKEKIIVAMLVSAIIWSVIISSIIYTFGPAVLPGFMQ